MERIMATTHNLRIVLAAALMGAVVFTGTQGLLAWEKEAVMKTGQKQNYIATTVDAAQRSTPE
jgi:hypothetical protein